MVDELITEDQQIDVGQLDHYIDLLYKGDTEAHNVLFKFKAREDSWLFIQQILSQSSQTRTLFLSLIIFVDGIRTKWGLLDQAQKDFYKDYFFKLTIDWSTKKADPDLINQADLVLIEILKNEWPDSWPNFMVEFLLTCKENTDVCINNLKILSLLSDEITVYPDELLTSDRQTELSRALENNFNLIFTHLESIFMETNDEELYKQTLLTLSHYLHWIDLNQIISTPLCQNLVKNLFPNPKLRAAVLSCFVSIATHAYATADDNMRSIFDLLIVTIAETLEGETDITLVYNQPDTIYMMIMTLSSFLLLDNSSLLQGILSETAHYALLWLVQLTSTCTEESFKIAIETWYSLIKLFFLEQHKVQPPPELIYQLQNIFISKMTRPPDFDCFVEEDIVEESDSELYENMRLTLVCLCNLKGDNMKTLLIEALENAQDINALMQTCWAIGAISGALSKAEEQQFILHVFNVLRDIGSKTQSQNESYIISGCFIHVAALYPRFLFNNWSYMRLVTHKIMEYCQIQSEPLQTMAVINLMYIVNRCSSPLLIPHPPNDPKSFLAQWLELLEPITRSLPMKLVPLFYEALAALIKASPDTHHKEHMVAQMLVLPVQSWNESLANISSEAILDSNFSMNVLFPLDIFGKIILIADFAFYPEIEEVINRTKELFLFYSRELSTIPDNPELVRIKNTILELYEAFLKAHPDSEIVPGLVDILFNDYSQAEPVNRFHKTIDCFSSMINKLKDQAQTYVPGIYSNIVNPTQEMIKYNFQDYPEIRLSHFKLISCLLTKIFSSIQSFDLDIFSSMLEGLLWGIAHPQNDISNLALNCVTELISDVVDKEDNDLEFKRVFFDQFFIDIINSLMSVLCDRSHKFLFSALGRALQTMFLLITSERVVLSDCENTGHFVAQSMAEKLIQDHQNISPELTLEFTMSLLNDPQNLQKFLDNIQYFLISIKKVLPGDRNSYRDQMTNYELINGINGPAMPDDFEGTTDEISEF